MKRIYQGRIKCESEEMKKIYRKRIGEGRREEERESGEEKGNRREEERGGGEREGSRGCCKYYRWIK